MNKTAIKNFAVSARNKLIADITYKAGLIGVSEKGIAQPLPQSSKDLQIFDIGTKDYAQVAGSNIEQRNALVRAIQEKERTSDYKTAFKAVIEEVAYTWFNRLIAIRFMEVNEYLPSRIRVLSSENPAKNEPDFVTTPFDTDMEFTMAEQDKIMQLKDENKLDELFRMLFIKQCNKLHEILPELFEETNNYTELLLSISFTDKDGIVYHLVHDIAEDDFNVEKEGQVEIIGWMYQYYVSERHNDVVNVRQKKAVSKDDVPAATQIFTTDWVVRYMVDNSLGKYWINHRANSQIKNSLKYYIESQEPLETRMIDPRNIKFFDPCMGSGHILVYAFDLLMEIYRECGYTDRDAAISILENNLYGLDIDKRAYQLSYFAIMMKARSYNRRAFKSSAKINIGEVIESDSVSLSLSKQYIPHEYHSILSSLVYKFEDAKEYGTLLYLDEQDYSSFIEYLDNYSISDNFTLDEYEFIETQIPQIKKLALQAKIITKKYEVVSTNPPYHNKYDKKLEKYILEQFPNAKADLYSAFIVRNLDYCTDDGYSAMMTPHGWMFTKSYEALRKHIVVNKSISSLIHMAKGAFYSEAAVDICSFVLRNSKDSLPGKYIRLEKFKGNMDLQATKVLEAVSNPKCDYVYERTSDEFERIDGIPFSYWVTESVYSDFERGTPLKLVSPPRQGMATTNNDKFLRMWFEVDFDKIGFGMLDEDMSADSGKKFFPYNKGGEFRRWYGNNYYVVNFGNHGKEVCDYIDVTAAPKFNHKNRVINREYYFKECITWSDISADFSGRYCPAGFIFDIKGSSGFPPQNKIHYILGLLNSKLTQAFIDILNPTITTQVGDMSRIPVLYGEEVEINRLVSECVEIAKRQWDYSEISWDFTTHFLTTQHTSTISEAFEKWKQIDKNNKDILKANEIALNKKFVEIYGLSDYLTEEQLTNVNVDTNEATASEVVKSLLSYAVGCMLGRYSLDVDRITYTGGKWDNSKYSSFVPDKDNCIPITDEEYFEDDIVGRFCEWLKVVFGADSLEANLTYIAEALGNKGATSREVIRNYFLSDFMKDHIKMYQKRPIYWLFDSGKQNGFKALVYMHRWNADTIGNMRVEYLHRMQRVYDKEIDRMQEIIDNSRDSREVSKATKRKDKLQKQIKETKDYDALVAHLALSRIDIDLDDGVKVNYEKVQTAPDGKKMQILAKI